MNEHCIVRSLALRIARDIVPDSPPAQRLIVWIAANAPWLIGEAWTVPEKPDWAQIRARLANAPVPDEPRPPVLALADALGRLLHLAPFDASLLTLMIACDRLPRLADLVDGVAEHVRDLPALLGELAGADANDAARRVRGSDVLKLGLVAFRTGLRHDDPIQIHWPLSRILDREPAPDALVDALAGRRQPPTLDLADFSHVRDADFLVRLLAGATRDRAHGINILIYGPPGTGKTELSRTLAAAAGSPPARCR